MESAARTLPRSGGIRWDRVARIALLLALAAVIGLYINPARTYLSTLSQADAKRAQVKRLKAENAQLEAQRQALRNPATIEQAARQLGMVRKGERAYAIQNLPAGR
jgi:cell division protein FtsB